MLKKHSMDQENDSVTLAETSGLICIHNYVITERYGLPKLPKLSKLPSKERWYAATCVTPDVTIREGCRKKNAGKVCAFIVTD